MKTKYIKIVTNLYDTNKTGQETSGRMTLKRYYMITDNPAQVKIIFMFIDKETSG